MLAAIEACDLKIAKRHAKQPRNATPAKNGSPKPAGRRGASPRK